MAYGSQDQGDRGNRSEPIFTLQERLSLRLASHGAEAQARLPSRLKGDGGSVGAPWPGSLFMPSSVVLAVMGRLARAGRKRG
ncbi:MAG TPA: hypothetical protein DIU09_15545 [Hyphomonadaceae bacterium]|nr:hypothetical protein AEM38_11890 [Hyphomonadaceae bacterium UKL13-1]HCP65986.1 hypothetical protein [Hyphomonadaceae bacterium]